jgi:putative methionine-R-sulfoxide reductase with GAF domain
MPEKIRYFLDGAPLTVPDMTTEDVVAAVAAIAADSGSRGERAARIAGVVRNLRRHRWVGVYEVTDTEVAILGYCGPGAPAYPRFPRTDGLTATAVATGHAVVVDDVTVDPRYLTAFGSTCSEMIVPVVDPDGATVLGTIDVESDRRAAFDDDERDLVERVAVAMLPLFTTH